MALRSRRRDFLARGIMTYSAIAFAPTLLTSLASRAAVLDGPAAPTLPFLVFDLVGGAGLPGSFLVGKQGGPEDMLASYDTLGWNPKSDSLDKRFGIPMPAGNISGFLTGMLSTMSPDAQSRLRIGSLCHKGQDDSPINTHSAIQLIARAGLRGSKITRPLGSNDSASGGNSGVPQNFGALKPATIRSVDNLNSLTGYQGVASELSDAAIQAIFATIGKLAPSQIKRLAAASDAQQIAALEDRAIKVNLKTGALDINTDPRKDANAQSVYGIREFTSASDQSAVIAALAFNSIQGSSGPAVIQLGGYDYHNEGQSTTDQKDSVAGQSIGRAVELAHRMKKPLMFQIITDGGVFANGGSRSWGGDAGEKSMTLIGYYNPKGAPAQRRLQVGHYTDGQAASLETVIGTDTSKVAYATLANYLAASGRMDLFDSLVPDGGFPKLGASDRGGGDRQTVENHLIFG